MESIKETYVTFEQAQALKRLGFDWECDHYYAIGVHDWHLLQTAGCIPANFNKDKGECPINCSAPALHIAAKWLREVKYIEVCAFFDNEDGKWRWFYGDMNSTFQEDAIFDFELSYETYEAAMSAGITAALK